MQGPTQGGKVRPSLLKQQRKSSSKGTTEWRFSLSYSFFSQHAQCYLPPVLQSFRHRNTCRSEHSVQQPGGSGISSHRRSKLHTDPRSTANPGYTRRTWTGFLDWAGWRGFIYWPTGGHSGCRQLYQCPVLRHRSLVPDPKPPLPGAKGSSHCGEGPQRKSTGLWGPTRWGVKEWSRREAILRRQSPTPRLPVPGGSSIVLSDFTYETQIQTKLRTSSQESQDIEPQLKLWSQALEASTES